MKYAIVEGQRREAQPKIVGECPGCGASMLAKCGDIKVWHWAHRGQRKCDPWWENETEWHRAWKNAFPETWQEFVQTTDDGERHIADVKTDQSWVIEFQHSAIKLDERQSREAFYGDMVWVIDGLRRKHDLKQFLNAVTNGVQISQRPLLVSVHPLDCRLVKQWSTSHAPVFFDFGDRIQPHGLWLLIPMGLDHAAYFALIGKENFISWHRNGAFNPRPFINQIKLLAQQRAKARRPPSVSPRMLQQMLRRSRRR
jgi:hypothetical protein